MQLRNCKWPIPFPVEAPLTLLIMYRFLYVHSPILLPSLMRFQHALAVQEMHFNLIVEPLKFYKNVSPSKELRDASNEADALLRDYAVDASLRVDVFNAKFAAGENIKASGKVLTPEEQRLVEKMILEGKRDGLALPENEREELKKLQKALSQTCLEFIVSLTLLYFCGPRLILLTEKLQRRERRDQPHEGGA